MNGETAKEAQKAPPIQSITESPCVPPRATSPPTTSSSSAPILYSDLNEYDFVHYASIYFQRKKPRLFHPFSLEELISYTTEVPLRPLHFIHQLFTSTVLEIERDIMIFMDITVGYVSSESPSTVNKKLLDNIVYQSYCNQSIFDEVVCFTIKEINNNPQETSCYLGFKLLYILLMMRRPSLPLLKYVLSFVYRQIVDSNVGGFAREIMKEYLENPSPAIGDFHMGWFAKICDLREKARLIDLIRKFRNDDELLVIVALFDADFRSDTDLASSRLVSLHKLSRDDVAARGKIGGFDVCCTRSSRA